jgi:hypothetical protein
VLDDDGSIERSIGKKETKKQAKKREGKHKFSC